MLGALLCQWSGTAKRVCSTWYHNSLFSPGLNFSYSVPVLLRNHRACSIVCICKELGYEKESIMSRYSAYTVPLHYRKLLCNLQNPWKQSLFHSIPRQGAELFTEQIFLSCDVGVCSDEPPWPFSPAKGPRYTQSYVVVTLKQQGQSRWSCSALHWHRSDQNLARSTVTCVGGWGVFPSSRSEYMECVTMRKHGSQLYKRI